MQQRTYTPKQHEMADRWWVVDAEGQTLGRLCSRIASVLRGKHRTDFTPHVKHNDHVIVVNARHVRVTGSKMKNKRYYRHSGYPGGLREVTLERMLATHPERVVQLAVRGMLPPNRLRRQLMNNLRVYSGPEHPHQAQSPRPLGELFAAPEGEA